MTVLLHLERFVIKLDTKHCFFLFHNAVSLAELYSVEWWDNWVGF
jgi:hypothetical protein